MKKKLNKVFSRAKSQNKVYQPTLARIRVNKKNNSKSKREVTYANLQGLASLSKARKE